MPPRPEGLEPDEELGDSDGGVIFCGDKGILINGCYGLRPRVFPEEKQAEVQKIPQTIARIPGSLDGHEKDWVRACKDGQPASANFDYSGPLTETVLLGNLAIRFPNRPLLWDAENLQVTNVKEANACVRRTLPPRLDALTVVAGGRLHARRAGEDESITQRTRETGDPIPFTCSHPHCILEPRPNRGRRDAVSLGPGGTRRRHGQRLELV